MVAHFLCFARHREAMSTTHPHLLRPNPLQRKADFTDDNRHGKTNPEACDDFDFEIVTKLTVVGLQIS
jgi:hypothetical protein